MKKLSRRPETDAAYLSAGRRHLARALRRHPEIIDPIEALLIDVATDPGVLTQNTVSLYRQEYAAILAKLCSELRYSDERRDRHVGEVYAALAKRRGIPPEPRTSSKKRIHIPKAEARRLFKALADRAKAEGVESPVLVLALLLFFAPRIGCRLCEWRHALIEGGDLVIRQAKLSDTRAIFPTRRVPLVHLSERQREAVPVLLDLLRRAISKHGSYHRWHRAAAELLARMCENTEIARVSFYAFRHIAIGVWTAAGLSPWQIAALAGHASTRTRRRHYGGGASGWEQDATPIPDAERVEALELRAASREPSGDRTIDPDPFVFEAAPTFRAAATPAPGTPADFRVHAAAIRARGESLMRSSPDTPIDSKQTEHGGPEKTSSPFRR
ncbi:hypothetical protein [Bosea sp. (in: a-proteobacteria)]|uniref:hypothetical protein n=1 Tax=Bosea sp. (in: a-proteobacteria) TaxID=1871050 RepID=UPI002621D47D|nr:hypothetical protein [Bosea sp. (in: a-proteobacteria)]MCO5092745.1 hypothetical protein [Bosea sp. (in: a-proteobacteria)]